MSSLRLVRHSLRHSHFFLSYVVCQRPSALIELSPETVPLYGILDTAKLNVHIVDPLSSTDLSTCSCIEVLGLHPVREPRCPLTGLRLTNMWSAVPRLEDKAAGMIVCADMMAGA